MKARKKDFGTVMALLGDFDDSYTSTGKGTLNRWANGLSFIPFIGGALAWPLGMISTVLESAEWLFKGKVGSAVTVLAAGTVGNAVNSLTSGVGGLTWWGANLGSGVTTSTSLGTHARALTESVIGGISGALGSKPQVLRSYPAGIGSISSGQMQSGPGQFASQESARRGQNADEAYQRYVNGEGGVHINELQSAQGRA